MHFREAAANLLTNPQLDPYAKIAAFKISAVRIEPAAGPQVSGRRSLAGMSAGPGVETTG
jgi:hypothetical protein